jgi:hypothetical protein
MAAFLLYLATHWMIVIIAVLIVVGLGVAAYVLKNLKFALWAIAIAAAGFIYQGAVTSGIQTELNKQIVAQSEIYQNRIDELNTLAAHNALRAKSDENEKDKLESAASDTPKNDGACLDAGAASRVSNIGRVGKRKPTAASAIRHPAMFFKGSR